MSEQITMHDRPISFHRAYAILAGGPVGGIFLGQAVHWQHRTPEAWWSKTYDDWRDETLLTEREIDRTRKILRDKGILVEKCGGARNILYQINFEVLAALTGTVPPRIQKDNRTFEKDNRTFEKDNRTFESNDPAEVTLINARGINSNSNSIHNSNTYTHDPLLPTETVEPTALRVFSEGNAKTQEKIPGTKERSTLAAEFDTAWPWIRQQGPAGRQSKSASLGKYTACRKAGLTNDQIVGFYRRQFVEGKDPQFVKGFQFAVKVDDVKDWAQNSGAENTQASMASSANIDAFGNPIPPGMTPREREEYIQYQAENFKANEMGKKIKARMDAEKEAKRKAAEEAAKANPQPPSQETRTLTYEERYAELQRKHKERFTGATHGN